MNHRGYVTPETAENPANRVTVADIDVVMGVTAVPFQQVDLPSRTRLAAEKHAAHVIIDTDYVQTSFQKQSSTFSADETPGTSYDHCRHVRHQTKMSLRVAKPALPGST